MSKLDENVKKMNRYILRLAKGDIDALDGIYTDFGGLFFAYTKYYLYDKNYAEDLLSEVFCKLVKKAPLFQHGENGLNWIIKIIKNDAINHNIKCGRHNAEYFDEIDDIAALIGGFAVTDDRLVLQDAMSELSETERKILYLKYWQGYTVREIAKACGTPPSTVQYTLKNALKRLNERIGEGKK